jgi:hypothetical protein
MNPVAYVISSNPRADERHVRSKDQRSIAGNIERHRVCVLSLMGGIVPAAAQAPAGKPNILVI